MELDYTNTYWNSRGKYEEEAEVVQLFRTSREKRHLRIYQAAANIYYDVYNNGGGNFDVRGDELKLLHAYSVYIDSEVEWLNPKLYVCDCDIFWEEDEENCPHEFFELTQKHIIELESFIDEIIKTAYDIENGERDVD